MELIHILQFYQYVCLDEPELFARHHLSFCKEIGLRGRILVACEGINGSVSGTEEQTLQYRKVLQRDTRFKNMLFKEDSGLMHPFKKMVVKVKPELVRFEQDVDLKHAGMHVTPREFLELAQKEDVIVLDARNDYESKVGKFKNAITPRIKNFREFPKVLELLKGKEDMKIAMYCTGGIRCEKASAFLKEHGFKEVYQLHGGILNFGKELPDTLWEGACFVFDKRLTSSINTDEKPITNCELCGIPCDLYKNCAHTLCDKFCIVCIECEKQYGGCCSLECFKHLLQRGIKSNICSSLIQRTA
ncbi:rhodanese-related sulfurtransferase [Candidatus Pacearchaeota archaeon]|nr:rhodanese-related sulfurtransferase [Candidatus Pacearchaeota archaeon]